jgi:F-type H+-transporting ATPase subunit b
LRNSTPSSRFSIRILSFASLAVLALAMAAPQARILAQEPASSAQAQPAPTAAPADAEKPEAAKSEAEENNVYRHAPIVQTLANLLHLPLETTARLFEFINFAIIVLALGIPLVRILPRIIRKRSQTLIHNLESARKVTEDANSRLSAVEAKLAKIDEDIAQIRAHVEEESKQDEARIKATIEEESGRIVAAAEQELAAAAAHARRGLRHFAADLAIEQAAQQLILTPETDRALIAEFVRDTAKGGQN